MKMVQQRVRLRRLLFLESVSGDWLSLHAAVGAPLWLRIAGPTTWASPAIWMEGEVADSPGRKHWNLTWVLICVERRLHPFLTSPWSRSLSPHGHFYPMLLHSLIECSFRLQICRFLLFHFHGFSQAFARSFIHSSYLLPHPLPTFPWPELLWLILLIFLSISSFPCP